MIGTISFHLFLLEKERMTATTTSFPISPLGVTISDDIQSQLTNESTQLAHLLSEVEVIDLRRGHQIVQNLLRITETLQDLYSFELSSTSSQTIRHSAVKRLRKHLHIADLNLELYAEIGDPAQAMQCWKNLGVVLVQSMFLRSRL